MATIAKANIAAGNSILYTDILAIIQALDGTTATDIRWKLSTLAQITAAQNDYAIGAGVVFRLSSDASRNITGIAGGADGRMIVIFNVGAQDIVLTNNDAASAAANRIITGTGASVTVTAAGQAILVYDGTSTCWRRVA